jgi:hypothetical protein
MILTIKVFYSSKNSFETFYRLTTSSYFSLLVNQVSLKNLDLKKKEELGKEKSGQNTRVWAGF